MRIVRTVADVREAVAEARAAGRRIGCVPTMGALHDGHLALVRRARAAAGFVVVTVFVNPTQFNDPGDLARYPRDESRDATLAAGAGADLVFAPTDEVMYPPGFSTTVAVRGVTETLEGAHRGPAHFHGVATIVTKLFGVIQPDLAVFGQKDAQQAVVIRRLVRDLDLPVELEIVPTVREPDGLALSSRNALLTPDDRVRAPALWQALEAIERHLTSGGRDPDAAVAAGRAILAEADIDIEYLAIVDAEDLAPPSRLTGSLLIAVAARLGAVRLIDNLPVSLPA